MVDHRRTSPTRERQLTWIVADVAVVVGLLLAGVAAPALSAANPLRASLAMMTLFVVPGYALSTAVFPASKDEQSQNDRRAGLTGGERVAVSFAGSISVTIVVGLSLAALSLPLSASNVVVGTAVVILPTLLLGTLRRLRTAPESQYVGPVPWLVRLVRAGVFEADSRERALNVALALSVTATFGLFAAGALVPHGEVRYTEVSLLTENDSGEATFGEYPTTLERGASETLVLSIENNEGVRTTYTAVVQLQRVTDDGRVSESVELRRLTGTVDDGDIWQEHHQVSGLLVGENLRLTYLVYEGTPPADPTRANAYETTSLWVTVDADTG
jgi:uncharacterized membrane protein